MPASAFDPAAAETIFLTEVVRGLAALCPAELVDADLTLPLGLSAWLQRASIGLPDAYDAMLRLRAAVVDASGLDRATEPVPLRVADPRAAVRNLGAYLYGLVARGARHAGTPPVELAERVLGVLVPGTAP
ncbi:MAG: hypothetical protein ACYDD6_00155 [Acidimicrobiales bacterium]